MDDELYGEEIDSDDMPDLDDMPPPPTKGENPFPAGQDDMLK